MNVFQILGLSFLGLLVVLTVAAARRGHLGRRAAWLWGALWIAAAVAIFEPDLTMTVANALGIDRGADLVFYCAILGMFAGFFVVFARLRRLEEGPSPLQPSLSISLPFFATQALNSGPSQARWSPRR